LARNPSPAPGCAQQAQFLQVQGLQRQPPFDLQLQVQLALVSNFFSIAISFLPGTG
jgi:hypothetical protein